MSAGGSRAEEPRPHAVALYRQHCRFRLRVSHKARRGGIGYRELRTARVARVEESRPEGRSRDTGQSDQGGLRNRPYVVCSGFTSSLRFGPPAEHAAG